MITRRNALLASGALLSVSMHAGGEEPIEVRARGPRAGSLEEEFRNLERAWADAVANADMDIVRQITDDDFAVTDATGHVWDRASYLDAVAARIGAIESLRIDELNVRAYGAAAVVTARLTYTCGPGRADLTGQYRFTKTYVRRESGWRCVAAQEGRILG